MSLLLSTGRDDVRHVICHLNALFNLDLNMELYLADVENTILLSAGSLSPFKEWSAAQAWRRELSSVMVRIQTRPDRTKMHSDLGGS